MDHQELERRLLFVLHRGFVEARLLATVHKHRQIFDLADALEPIAGYMDRWEEQHLPVIRFNLANYRKKYPNPSFDYLGYLDIDPQPERF
jgi:hypothetical protein